MHVFLIGMPGAGKSTLSRKLAQHLGLPFIDTDWEVEKRAGCTLAALIAAEGEAAFRALEAEVLLDVLAEADAIVATGGGMPVQPGAIEKIKEAGLVVYLPISQQEAVGRIEADTQERLHLAGDVAGKWGLLFAQREPFYNQAHIVCKDPVALLAYLAPKQVA